MRGWFRLCGAAGSADSARGAFLAANFPDPQRSIVSADFPDPPPDSTQAEVRIRFRLMPFNAAPRGDERVIVKQLEVIGDRLDSSDAESEGLGSQSGDLVKFPAIFECGLGQAAHGWC
jgi:hypothetical protein